MNKNILIGAGAALWLGACQGGAVDSVELVENATMVGALSVGEDQEALDGAPDDDVDGAADEMTEAVEVEREPWRQCDLGAIRQQVVATYDEDGDGELNDSERAGLEEDFGARPMRQVRWARRHVWRRLVWIYDADNDMTLNEAERQELRNDLETRCLNRQAQLVGEFDADGDGELNDAEWTAARQALIARVQARRQEILARYDANQNGELGPVERFRLREDLRAAFVARRAALIQQFDADASGTLDDGERAALRDFLKSRVRGEHFGSGEPPLLP